MTELFYIILIGLLFIYLIIYQICDTIKEIKIAQATCKYIDLTYLDGNEEEDSNNE